MSVHFIAKVKVHRVSWALTRTGLGSGGVISLLTTGPSTPFIGVAIWLQFQAGSGSVLSRVFIVKHKQNVWMEP